MPKVSICVPTYNNIECIRQLLPSVLSQSFTDYELIITDDSTNLEIEEFMKENDRECIRYFHNEKPLGHIFNWNKAISYAVGEYIKILFSDDFFTDIDSLAKYVQLLDDNPEVIFAFSGSMQVTDEGTYERKIPDSFIQDLQKDYRHLFLGNMAGAPSGTIYRNNGICFDENSNWASDLILYLTLLENNPKFAYTKEPLISIGEHGEQYTHKFATYDERKFVEAQYMYEKFHFGENKRCREFFMKEYIMRFKKDKKTALAMGFTGKEYNSAKREYIWKYVIVEYTRVAWKKLTK